MTNQEMERAARKIKTLEAKKDQIEAQIDELENQLKNELDTRGTDTEKVGIFKVVFKKWIENRFDQTAFRTENSAMYERYKKPMNKSRFQILV